MRSIRKLVLLSCLFTASHSFGQCPVLPTPVSYELLDGRSFLDDGLKVNLSAIDSFSANYLKREFTKLYAVALIDDTSKFALHFHRVENNGGPQYGIAFEPENKLISYARESDLFYAINSLLQLVKTEDERKYIEHCLINDYPRFEWRGLHFDVSRHFFTVNEVKRFIDLMAHYKFNVFHWHLTDDQGWRIEINKYPKLTEIGAWRDSTVIGHYSDSPRRYERERYGGFYTQAEIKEVIP